MAEQLIPVRLIRWIEKGLRSSPGRPDDHGRLVCLASPPALFNPLAASHAPTLSCSTGVSFFGHTDGAVPCRPSPYCGPMVFPGTPGAVALYPSLLGRYSFSRNTVGDSSLSAARGRKKKDCLGGRLAPMSLLIRRQTLNILGEKLRLKKYWELCI